MQNHDTRRTDAQQRPSRWLRGENNGWQGHHYPVVVPNIEVPISGWTVSIPLIQLNDAVLAPGLPEAIWGTLRVTFPGGRAGKYHDRPAAQLRRSSPASTRALNARIY